MDGMDAIAWIVQERVFIPPNNVIPEKTQKRKKEQ